MTLYKYLRAARIDVLQTELIRYTQPALLNDPFEMTPYVDELVSKDDIERLVTGDQFDALIDKGLESYPDALRPALKTLMKYRIDNDPTFRENTFALGETLFEKMRPILLSRMDEVFRHRIGVLSLSGRADNLLMWAHYGDRHTGFVLALDEKHSVFNERLSEKDELRHLRKVVYSSEKPSKHLQDLDIVDLLLTKSLDWSHEDEWRIAKPLDSAVATNLNSDAMLYFFPLPAAAVQGVILGAQMDDALRELLIEIVRKDSRYSHVWLKEAELQRDRFALKLATLPAQLRHSGFKESLSVRFVHDDSGTATSVSDAIASIANEARLSFLDLSALDCVFVVKDVRQYVNELIPLLNWQGDSAVLTSYFDKEPVIHLYLQTDMIDGLVSADPRERDKAVHFVHRQFAHVHNSTKKCRMLGGEILSEPQPGKSGMLRPVAMKAWDSYVSARLSASSLSEDEIVHICSRLREQVRRLNDTVIIAIVDYRQHAQIPIFLGKVLDAIGTLLEEAASIMGYIDGPVPDPTKLASELERAIESTRLKSNIVDLRKALRNAFRTYPEWDNISIIDDVVAVIRDICFDFGISFRNRESDVYVAVP